MLTRQQIERWQVIVYAGAIAAGAATRPDAPDPRLSTSSPLALTAATGYQVAPADFFAAR
ncbi:MAG: hypothetical protein KIT79_06415 [Deltaproteobacteria bacterium]|nr:hypothetical protein [Deltaproteobacteria bacterium]